MSSPQRDHLKENNLQNSEGYLSADQLNKVDEIKENLENTGYNQQQQTNHHHSHTKIEKLVDFENRNPEELSRVENRENETKCEEMLQQQQTAIQFEMMKHCGLVDDLNMYDQYDGQQLDSSSASSKTEEMPILSSSPQINSPNPASPHSDTGSLGSVNNDVKLNTSHNSAATGRTSVGSNTNLNNLNESNDLKHINQPPVTTGVNVSVLLSNVSNVNSSLANVASSPTPAIAAQQINTTNQNLNTANSNFLSEISALIAAAGNQNSNLPNSSSNQIPNQQTNNANNSHHQTNSLTGLNGLNLLNTLTNGLPINQIATLLAGNAGTNPTISQQMLLQQAANLGNLGKLSGFNLPSTNDLHEQLQQIQQQQQLQQIQQILFLNQLNQQPNISTLGSIAPLLPQNLQALLQNANLFGAQSLLNTTPINQQSPSTQPPQNRPGSASGIVNNNVANNSNLNLPQLLQQLQEAQVLQAAAVNNNSTSATSLLSNAGLLSNLTSNLNSNQNVSNLLQHTLHNANNTNSPLVKQQKERTGVDLNTLNNLTQHLLAKQQQSPLNGTNQNTVAAALANHLQQHQQHNQQNAMECDNNANTVFNKLASVNNQIKMNNATNSAFQNNTVASALLQQQKSVLQLNQQQQNSNNAIVNVQQQLIHLQKAHSQQQQPNVKQLSPQFESNSNHSNFSNSNSSSTNSKLANSASSSRLKLENNDATLNSVLNSSAQGNQTEDVRELEELEQFAKYFKQKRIKMGFTQGDVGQAMGKNYGNDFSQTTISRFEALNLSFKNMLKLKPILERWLHDADRQAFNNSASLNINPITNGQNHNNQLLTNQSLLPNNNSCIPNLISSPGVESMCKRRKKRTSIETQIRVNLERAFIANQKPTFEEIAELAVKFNMDKEVVRVWFCNRRQKQRKMIYSPDACGPNDLQESLGRSSEFPEGQNPYSCYDFNETGNSNQLHQRLANQFENINRANLALRSPSPLSSSNQYTAVSPGSQSDSEMNIVHSLPPSPVSSRKYSIRQDSFS